MKTPPCSPPAGRRPHAAHRQEDAYARNRDQEAVANLSIASSLSPEEVEQGKAFYEYVALAQKAQASMNYSDAIAAGKAWGRFIYLFCGAPQ